MIGTLSKVHYLFLIINSINDSLLSVFLLRSKACWKDCQYNDIELIVLITKKGRDRIPNNTIKIPDGGLLVL